jgi:hypothetical protein
MQILSYDWFFDREKDKPCLVAGTAPTIINFPYDRFKGVYLTCGNHGLCSKELFQADYWVNAAPMPIPEIHWKSINSFSKTTFIFADSVVYSCRPTMIDLNFLREKLTVNWFAYDQRHFGHQPCKNKLNCCRLIDLYPERDTLQEVIQKRYHVDHHYSSASTVAIHTLAFALLLGCNPIYLQGIELPVHKDDCIHYGDKPSNQVSDKKSGFFINIVQILKDFKYLVTVACENNIEIYNLSRTSPLNQISNLKYKDPSTV